MGPNKIQDFIRTRLMGRAIKSLEKIKESRRAKTKTSLTIGQRIINYYYN